MQLDYEDMLAGTFSRIVLTALFFVSSIWLGSVIGGLAWLIGNEDYWDISDLRALMEAFLYSPLFLINLWLVPNVGFLAIMLIWVFMNDGTSHLTWGLILGMESLFVMLGRCLKFDEPKETLISWSCWLILLGMAEAGIWLHRQMRHNRWAREMMELSAENAMLRAQRAAMATEAPSEEADLK